MSRSIPADLRRLVASRAKHRCEYCKISDSFVLWPHEPDHVIAEQHGGQSVADNLALACFHCNRFKGPNIASIDPLTGHVSRLYNPRAEIWIEHFRWDGSRIIPLTKEGRATVELLRLNSPERLAGRDALLQAGLFKIDL